MLRISSEVSILAMAAIFLASPALQAPQDPPAAPGNNNNNNNNLFQSAL